MSSLSVNFELINFSKADLYFTLFSKQPSIKIDFLLLVYHQCYEKVLQFEFHLDV